MDITLKIPQRYKSFQGDMYVTNLNPFTVLTGRNGAGKSQFLELISRHTGEQFDARVSISGRAIARSDILSITDWSMPKAPAGGLNETMKRVNDVYAALMSIDDGGQPPRNKFSQQQVEMILTISEQLHKAGFHRRTGATPTISQVSELIPDNFFQLDKFIVNEKIALVIFEWHLDATEKQKSFNTPDNPIFIFNQLCKDFDMDLSLPIFKSVRTPYEPKLRDRTGMPIDWDELSSGEQVIFRLICWLFFHKLKYSSYPELMLLDEPDAHLNPKMIRRLIDNLQSVLVEQLGVRVIMTTHSPNTIALCDAAALYELERTENKHQIVKLSRTVALAKFSDGLLFIQEDNRLVFIEGTDDVTFYNEVYRLAVQYHRLPTTPSFNFIAASKANPDHGGVQEVMKMVPRFEGSSIENLVYGLIDNDSKNTETDRIKVLRRYTLENYLYDPLIILISLITHGKHTDPLTCLSGLETGDHISLLSDPTLLQKSIDEVVKFIKSGDPSLVNQYDPSDTYVTWLIKRKDPITYSLPKWYLEIKKNDLLQLLHKPTNQIGKFIERNKQLVALTTLGAVPSDIQDMFKAIQSGK